MGETAIKVTNLKKRYRIGVKEEQSQTFAGQLANMLKAPLKNFRYLKSLTKFKGDEDESVFWALKGLDFEVQKGEVLGIIGKNGAGKSTLLKILSRVTDPTEGRVDIYGRVASLLEVGTGFHPELTGRENIYLNGTILGMTRKEIDQKFDAIVDFSGIEKFIDTPTKRYSSGMRVRLAFAVAAHLDPEILIIDEVLAVGDVEFQKKCLGKMSDVASEGRTVLFVSHNMTSIRALCKRGMLIEDGQIAYEGAMDEVIEKYVSSSNSINQEGEALESNGFVLDDFQVLEKDGSPTSYPHSGGSYFLTFSIEGNIQDKEPAVILSVSGSLGSRLVLLSSRLAGVNIGKFHNKLKVDIYVDALMLMPGEYFFNLFLREVNNGALIAGWEQFQNFEVYPNPESPAISLPSGQNRGVVYTETQWKVLHE